MKRNSNQVKPSLWINGYIIIGICLFIFCSAAVCFSQEEQNAEEILLKAGEVRNPQLDYVVQVRVTSVKTKQDPRQSTFEVMVKGRDKTVIKTLSPAMENGRILLMRDKDFWVFLPDVSKPLRISLQERLIGDVANAKDLREYVLPDFDLIRIPQWGTDLEYSKITLTCWQIMKIDFAIPSPFG